MSGDDGGSHKRASLPPCLWPQGPQLPPISSPYSRILANHPGNQQMWSQNLRTTNLERPSHSRSLSQPLPFGLDSLYHAVANEQRGESSYSLLQPSPLAPPASCYGMGAGFHEAHRRTGSEVPFQPSGALDMPVQVVERDPICAGNGDNNNTEMTGEEKSEMVNMDEDVFSTYLNLDYTDASNIQEALDSQDKVNGVDRFKTDETTRADDESWSAFERAAGVSSLPDMSEGVRRVAPGDVSQTNIHLRSVSDHSFMENIDLANDFLEIPPYSGTLPGQLLSQMCSSESTSNGVSLMIGDVGFTADDQNKITANKKLTEIALSDPRRAKRILSNRRSAARSKERKLRYVAELEHRSMTLQNEANMLAAQLAQLEHESSAMTTQNNELKLRLQGLEQRAHLQEALKAALTEEVQRLKVANVASYSKIHQCEMLQLFGKQEMQPQKQQTESNNEVGTPAEHESKQ
ncbi:bZIP transcription factor 29-like [Primulina eburnea]|uniref:bZIP transcription factor 29-like n=1 Tax=Primulina eburnea TaxID=1245227 RepID=UPI003C6BD68F